MRLDSELFSQFSDWRIPEYPVRENGRDIDQKVASSLRLKTCFDLSFDEIRQVSEDYLDLRPEAIRIIFLGLYQLDDAESYKLTLTDYVLGMLDREPNPTGFDSVFLLIWCSAPRAFLEVTQSWLLMLADSKSFKGDRYQSMIGRAFDVICYLLDRTSA